MNNPSLREFLSESFCSTCRASLAKSRMEPISESRTAILTHLSCPSCEEEFIVTASFHGFGVEKIKTDLTKNELKEVFQAKPLDENDILDLYLFLKKEKLWKHLKPKDEQLPVRRSKNLGRRAFSPL